MAFVINIDSIDDEDAHFKKSLTESLRIGEQFLHDTFGRVYFI